jgi:non-specific serine/threonine protein kinase
MQEGEEEFLFCSPDQRLWAGHSAHQSIREAFAVTDANGVLLLATLFIKAEISSSLAWARQWGGQFLTKLCQNRSPQMVAAPSNHEIQLALEALPLLKGAEYVDEALLVRLWDDLRNLAQEATEGHKDGISGWLREIGGGWHLIGRVTFHLAENKRNHEKPFAFLATYTEQLSADGGAQHIPLARVFTSNQKDPRTVNTLLEPVRTAAALSSFVHDLLQSKRLFQALSWTPDDAYCFLKEIPLFERCGLVVKLPDWWKARRASRPVVTVSIEAPEGGGMGLSTMLVFRSELTLGGEKLSEAELALIRASPTGLVSLRGQWVEINHEQLQQVLKHWGRVQSHHETRGLSFHEGMRWLSGFTKLPLSPAADFELEHATSWSEVVAGKNLKEWIERLRAPAELENVPGLRAVLRPYQKKGVAWMHFATGLGLGVCLADDMGLGKTIQVISLLCLRCTAKAQKGDPSILVVPASLLGNWLREIGQFAPHLHVFTAHPSLNSRETLADMDRAPEIFLRGFDAVLTTYGQLQRSVALSKMKWDLAVLDEAQAIKNPATQQSRSVKKLSARARVALTGTPIENRLGDLWSLFDFLNPGLLGGAAEFSEAARRFEIGFNGYGPIRKLIGPYMLRRLKTDRRIIDDLPEKIEMRAECLLTKKQAILYGKLVAQLRADIEDESLDPNQRRGLVLGYLVKFKQVCNHPSHWSGDGRFLPEDSGKFMRLVDLGREIVVRQEKCLVFTQFREMTNPIVKCLEDVFGRTGLVLHGGTPIGKRQKIVQEFQQKGGPPFLVLSVKAGGTGLTLTEANHVIHFDRWWNPAVENQATDRAFRIGQKRNVLVHKFVCPGTIEEKVDALLRKKGALSEDILSTGAGAEKLLMEMDNEALLSLVSLDLQSIEG